MSMDPVFLTDEILMREVLPPPPKLANSRRPPRKTSPFTSLVNADKMKEAEVSALFEQAVNDHDLTPGLQLRLSENNADSSAVDEDGQKIDGALFAEEYAPNDKRPHWPDQVVAIEFKTGGVSFDPFVDASKSASNANTDQRRKVRGQIITYAELIFSIQHRTCLIMLLVMGSKLRVIRWDRSGLATSRAIDYVDEWKLTCKILWRISLLHKHAPELLGMDPTATRIRNTDPRWVAMDEAGVERHTDVDHQERVLGEGELRSSSYTFRYVRKAFLDSLVDYWPRYELEVSDDPDNWMQIGKRYLVGKPYHTQKGMAGRGTRGYVALDPETGEFVWLKVAWRTDYDGVDREGDTLHALNAARVSNVPTLIIHGDVLEQVTQTPKLWQLQQQVLAARRPLPVPALPSSSSNSGQSTSSGKTTGSSKRKYESDDEDDAILVCPFRRHRQYRLAVREVCLELRSFQTGSQLLSIVGNCIQAHNGAFVKLGIIHRDISGGNILIFPKIEFWNGEPHLTWKGVLTDWELAKKLDSPRMRQPQRTGTWQFMSVAVLSDRFKVMEICDDLESFFYVVLYYAVRYLKSNIPDVPKFIEEFFDAYTVNDDVYGVGQAKSHLMKTGGFRLSVTATAGGDALTFSSKPLDTLLEGLHTRFKALYKVRDHDSRIPVLPLPSEVYNKFRAKTPEHEQVRLFALDEFEEVGVEEMPKLPPAPPPPPPPVTDEEHEFAKEIQSHRVILLLFRRAIESKEWPKGVPKPSDLVPDDRKAQLDFGPTVNSVNQVDEKNLKPLRHSIGEVLSQASVSKSGPSKDTSSKSSKRRRRNV